MGILGVYHASYDVLFWIICHSLSASGSSQVKVLLPSHVTAHLPKMIPDAWFKEGITHLHHQEDEALISWLETLWYYLRQHYPSNLSAVAGLPILAVSSKDDLDIHLLSSPSNIVLQSAMGCNISEAVRDGVSCLGVAVVPELHPAVASHAAVLGTYVHVPLPEDVLEAVLAAHNTIGKQGLDNFVINASQTSRAALCEIWCKLAPGKLSAAGKAYLLKLPLFKLTVNAVDSFEHASATSVNVAAPVDMLPVSVPTRMLDLRDEAPRHLAKLLGITPMKLSLYFSHHVFPSLHALHDSKDALFKTMNYVMDNFPLLLKEDPGFRHHLSQVAFLENSSGECKVPSDLFDPDDEFVMHFFLGDDVLPMERYQQAGFLVFLRQLGLKGAAHIQAHDVLMAVRSLEHQMAVGNDKDRCMEKANAIFKHLCEHAHQLSEIVDGQPVSTWIRSMVWVPTLQHPPKTFPSSLPWFKSPSLEAPEKMFSPDWIHLTACVAPVMMAEPTKTLAEAFSWDQPPLLELVLKQMKIMIQQYVPTDKTQFLPIFSSIYKHLSSESDLRESLDNSGIIKWIWNGEGFSEPQSIVLKKSQLDLSPYCYCLPLEMARYKDLFGLCGASCEVTSDVMVRVLRLIKNKYSTEGETMAESNGTNAETEDCSRDLQMSIDILNILKSHMPNITQELLDQVVIPIQTEQEKVCLLPLKDCTYCDIESLQQGSHPMALDVTDDILFIHPNLPVATAEALGVPALMSRVLHAEELDITGWGQEESLTNRLRQLIEDYSDGFAIPKELVQNADDAGATTVKFLYDERPNEEFKTLLFDEGMKNCQGPALWVYNNAEFDEQDFHNIIKLGGASKEGQLDKIGRFGLGFNAVYNLTDVPSLLSGKKLVILDPHKNHLGHVLKDRSKPGIRIDLQTSKHRTLIRKLSDQFEPYRKVFGCEIESDTENHFHGTLFRFPLRDHQAAQISEISTLHYDRKEMTKLISLLVQGAQSLLLFTQNVKTIEVFHLPSGEKNPENARKVLSIQKDLQTTLNVSGSLDSTLPLSSMLSDGAKYLGNMKAGWKYQKTHHPSAICEVKVAVNVTGDGESLTAQKAGTSEQLWLVSSTVGQKQSVSLALDRKDVIPVASVAAPLCCNGKTFQAVSIESIGQKGHLFCFLPLPIETGLPVHVNGAFAVQSNRRHLCEQTEDDKYSAKAKWNKALLQDAVALAYENLLLSLSERPQNGMTSYTDLWPKSKDAMSVMFPLVQEFYDRVSKQEAQSIPLCSDGRGCLPIRDAVFLDPDLRGNPVVGDKAMAIFKQYVCHCPFAFDLPKTIIQSFEATAQSHYIREKTYGEVKFFSEVFFDKVSDIDAEQRDALMLYVLDHLYDDLSVLARKSSCIPVSPKGKKLKCPKEIINPQESAAQLYAPNDERFPFGEDYCSVTRLSALEKLGMQTTDLHWEDLYERAESIAKLRENDPIVMKTRQAAFLHFLNTKMGKTNQIPKVLKSVGQKLQKIPFLSPMKKPENFPLPWKGENSDENILLAPEDMCQTNAQYLLSCSQYIADDKAMTPEVKSLLGFKKKEFPADSILTQFEHTLQVDLESVSDAQYETLRRVCISVYNQLQLKCQKDPRLQECIRKTFGERPCILLERRYVKPSEAAFNLKQDCAPYLYHIPETVECKFHSLYSILGVQDELSIKDFAVALQRMKKEYDGKMLRGDLLRTTLNLVYHLDACISKHNITMEQVTKQCGTIFIPDSLGMLQESSTLCFNDCPWIADVKQGKFTHSGITLVTSQRLGVKTKKQETLAKHSEGLPFGQKDNLIGSLKRVIKNYPSDHGILKEFVQNADDAEAKELHFLLDGRYHPTDCLFDSSWKPLQGPALCIYNDSSFSRADLEGIQRLGSGSKTYDPNKTGEYGIGFSSVYHLTDSPSLLSKGEELGETLCVFDPQCKYVPGATEAEPGRLFSGLDVLRTDFPDVFAGYLEDIFHGEERTMFRLPLRSKEMAKGSSISQKPVALKDVKEMLSDLQQEALDILLFTNNLHQLTFSDINMYSGQLQNSYTVQSILHPVDEKKRAEFHSYVKQVGSLLKEGVVSIDGIRHRDVMYDVTISDNNGVEELWRVSQRIGLAPGKHLPVECKDAFDRGDLCLLPRGGAACLIKRSKYGRHDPDIRMRKTFCSLPLPEETGLSMNINGHFALGFENRRYIWRSKNETDYRQAWNNFLFNNLIAPCYLDVMKSMRLQGMNAKFDDDIAYVACSRDTLVATINNYQKLFPVSNPEFPDWDVLVKAVLSQSAEHDIPILPSISGKPIMEKPVTKWQVVWLPPCSQGHKQAFFKEDDSSNQSQASEQQNDLILRDVLQRCGLKVVEACSEIKRSYQNAGVAIQFVSPAHVNLFLQSCTSDESMGYVGELPCKLENTPFVNTKNFKIVLNFCKRDSQIMDKLDGLPLCLTKDCQLRVFRASDPKFPATHQHLLKGCDDQFLHQEVSKLLENLDVDGTPVLRRFDINAFADRLHNTLDRAIYCQNESPVEWKNKTSYNLPNDKWVYEVWDFLRTEIYPVSSGVKSSATTGKRVCTYPVVTKLDKRKIKQALAPLSQWCIVPAKCNNVSKLYSVGNAEQVLDLRSLTYTDAANFLMRELGVPLIDTAALEGTSSSTKNLDIVSNLVTAMDNPVGVLRATLISCTINNDCRVKLSKGKKLLHYFSKHITEIQEDSGALALLPQLPLYHTIHSDVIPLTGCIVYTLPANIPLADMDAWQSKSGTVFLAHEEELKPLYSVLGYATISGLDAYCKYILQHFELISHDARLIHLHYLYKTYLKTDPEVNLRKSETDLLLQCLRNLCFLEDKDGNLCPASEFFDPHNELFYGVKFKHELAPPEKHPFSQSDWLSLLRMMGLQSNVTSAFCMESASQIAHLGKDPDNTSAYTKSKALIQHLFKMEDASSRDQILAELAHVPFVQPAKASVGLNNVCSQIGDMGNGKLPYVCCKNSFSKEYENLVWTSASLLPYWADPSKQRDLSRQVKARIQECLGMQSPPPLELVMRHFQTLCSHMLNNPGRLPDYDVLTCLFKPIYQYLQEHLVENPDALKSLKDLPCVLVQSPVPLIKASCTVLNLGRGEEISPYLKRVPAELGEFQELFLWLGAQENATVDQFASVLECMYHNIKDDVLTANELKTAYKVIKALADTLLKEEATFMQSQSLYLPDDRGQLMEVSQLVFIDTPADYDRVQELGIPFLFDMLECGIEHHHIEKVFQHLPSALRPSYLSEHVQETLVRSSQTSATCSRQAGLVGKRLKSELFQRAVTRLARHEASKTGQHLENDDLADVLDRLSSITVWGVEHLQTHLVYKGHAIRGSQLDKPCFIEKKRFANNLDAWYIYLHQPDNFNLDVQILLAGALNTILGGLLRDSVLFLLPLFLCPEADMQAHLDALNVRMDHTFSTVRKRTLPIPGEPIPSHQRQWIHDIPGGDFLQEEFVAFKGSRDADFIYAVIEEPLISRENYPSAKECGKFYRINVGSQRTSECSALYKMERCMHT